MAWIFFQELAGFRSLSDLGSGLSPTVKPTDTVRASYCPECDRVTLCLLPYGTTCELSKKRCSPKSTSSTGDFPAKTSALQDVAQAWEASAADWSEKCSDLSVSFDPASCSWKTCQPSAPAGQTLLPANWPASGMTLGGRLYQRLKSEPLIFGSDGLPCFPTPTVCGNYNRAGASANSGNGLATFVRMWPTPTTRDWKSSASNLHGKNAQPLNEVVRWSTPRASDASKGGPNQKFGAGGTPLPAQVGGQLNPPWVEWLMGYPIGWTELKDWATQWYRLKRGKRS